MRQGSNPQRSRPLARPLGVFLLCLLFLQLCLPSLAHAASLTPSALDPDDVLLFDIRAEGLRLGDGVHGYRTGEGACLDLAEFSAAVDLALSIDLPRGLAQGWAFSERNLVTIDRSRARVTANGGQHVLAAGTIYDSPTGWCVATSALEQWFQIGLAADMLEATVTVTSRTPLPAVAAAMRAERARTQTQVGDLAKARVAGPPVETVRLPYKGWRTPSVDVSLGLTREPARLGGEYELFAAGEVAWLSADGRLASNASGVPQSLRLRLYRDDPDARLMGALQGTSAAIGDVSGLPTPLAVRGVTGRGGTITNRPLGQSSQFDRTDLVGDAPVGWEVELYRNGDLSGLVKVGADGRYAFRDVQLVYGSNRLEIVKYGPQGQVRRERRGYEVGQSAVPPGQGWWWAHVVEENRDLVGFAGSGSSRSGWRFGAGLDYGLGLRTSAALAAHSLVRAGQRLKIVETELRRGFGPFALALGHAVDTHGGMALQATALGRIGQTALTARLLRNRALVSEVIEPDLCGRMELGLDRPIRIGGLMLPVHFDLARSSGGSGRRQIDVGSRLSFSTRSLSVSLTSRLRQIAEPSRPYGPVEGLSGLLLSARVGGIAMRGELNVALGRGSGLSDARISGEGSLTRDDRWQASAGYSWNQRDVSLAGAYSRHFRAFTLSSTLSGSGKGGIAGRLGLLFSIGPDGRGRFGRMTSARLASTGAVAVRVLRDGGDGDGAAQAALAPLPGEVQLRLGGQPARPDRSGWVPGAPIVLAALAPAAPVLIGVDPASLDDPLLDPAVRAVRVIPRKGLVLPLDLKVAATGVIEGRIVRADGSEAAGESLTLLDGRDRAVASVVSDFDGGFLFEKVHYGRYRLALGTSGGLVPLRPDAPPLTVGATTPNHVLPAIVLP